jgi:hypothetical protein
VFAVPTAPLRGQTITIGLRPLARLKRARYCSSSLEVFPFPSVASGGDGLIPLPGISHDFRVYPSVDHLYIHRAAHRCFRIGAQPCSRKGAGGVLAHLCRHLRETPGLTIRATVSQPDCTTTLFGLPHVYRALHPARPSAVWSRCCDTTALRPPAVAGRILLQLRYLKINHLLSTPRASLGEPQSTLVGY